MRSLLTTVSVALAFGASLAAMPAHAVSLATNGSWAGFTTDDLQGPFATPLVWLDEVSYNPISFDFTVPTGYVATLTVVDTGYSGETFKVTDNGNLLGQTGPAVDGFGGTSITNFDAALANTNYSRASFTLSEGSHSISGSLASTFSGINASTGGHRVTLAPVPEPATVFSLLAGLALLAAVARRRAA